jgi:hypothetical protein
MTGKHISKQETARSHTHLHVIHSDKREVLIQQRAHRRERVHRAAGRVIVPAEPILLGRKLLHPRKGRRQKQDAAAAHQLREAREEGTRVRQTAHEIGGNDEVEIAEVGAQRARVALSAAAGST